MVVILHLGKTSFNLAFIFFRFKFFRIDFHFTSASYISNFYTHFLIVLTAGNAPFPIGNRIFAIAKTFFAIAKISFPIGNGFFAITKMLFPIRKTPLPIGKHCFVIRKQFFLFENRLLQAGFSLKQRQII